MRSTTSCKPLVFICWYSLSIELVISFFGKFFVCLFTITLVDIHVLADGTRGHTWCTHDRKYPHTDLNAITNREGWHSGRGAIVLGDSYHLAQISILLMWDWEDILVASGQTRHCKHSEKISCIVQEINVWRDFPNTNDKWLHNNRQHFLELYTI